MNKTISMAFFLKVKSHMVFKFHIKFIDKKNFVPHCPEALRYAKVWGRDIVRSLALAYAKRLFPDSNP